jgi:hypothetical protein
MENRTMTSPEIEPIGSIEEFLKESEWSRDRHGTCHRKRLGAYFFQVIDVGRVPGQVYQPLLNGNSFGNMEPITLDQAKLLLWNQYQRLIREIREQQGKHPDLPPM